MSRQLKDTYTLEDVRHNCHIIGDKLLREGIAKSELKTIMAARNFYKDIIQIATVQSNEKKTRKTATELPVFHIGKPFNPEQIAKPQLP